MKSYLYNYFYIDVHNTGTTFSGFTYAIDGSSEVYEVFNYPGTAGRPNYPKVPTSLLYDTSTPAKPIHWGWEAENNKHTNPCTLLCRVLRNVGTRPKAAFV